MEPEKEGVEEELEKQEDVVEEREGEIEIATASDDEKAVYGKAMAAGLSLAEVITLYELCLFTLCNTCVLLLF